MASGAKGMVYVNAGLKCVHCGQSYPLDPMFHGCPACRDAGQVGVLRAQYDLPAIRAAWAAGCAAGVGMWRFRLALPLPADAAPVSLGEGATPLLQIPSQAVPDGRVYLKVEAVNPTGSFKDRLNSVAVSMARYHGFRGIACTSTGNHGVSLAAYAAAAGMRMIVLFPDDAVSLAVREVRHYGGLPITAPWDERGRWLRWLVDDAGWAMSGRNFPREFGNPYGMEGYKTIAYEIVHALGDRPPGTVFAPVGGGDGIYGLWRGFVDLHRAGIIASLPRLIGCQTAATASAYHAFIAGLETVEPVELRPSIAVSLIDRQSGDHALWAVRESRGEMIAVTEPEIRRAVGALGRVGVCVEPAAAAAYAGIERRLRNIIPPTVCVLTGGGQRWPDTFAEDPGMPASPRTLHELMAFVGA
ncbi:MAG TPA: pyridoxal-phosphate dependent enzyme [bacterium]|nr:pyridoxal-phosphate dependent enzyme [bacterium]